MEHTMEHSEMAETAAQDRGYTLTRTYDAPRAKVWRAISEADLFAQWFGAQVDLVIHSWDLREGGEWTGTMTYEGTEIPWAGRFVEVDEPSRLAVQITDEGTVKDTDDVLTYTLTDKGDQTLLEIRQSGGGLTDEQYEQAREGTAGFLEELAKVAATL
jgi:uncharacterized protein YndB with AHSA1/START domain